MSLGGMIRAEVIAVPRNMKLLAVPLFELYDNAVRSVHTLLFLPMKESLTHFIPFQLRADALGCAALAVQVQL